MNIPLMAITPTTAKMLAKYHGNNGDKVTEAMWLRVGLILFAANAYTDGHLTEAEMHTHFTCATTWNDDSLRDHAYVALKGV